MLHNWKVCHFSKLPAWMQDNEFLLDGHRPPLPSFRVCFKSIFRIHTETGNIWTHMVGCFLFICISIYSLNWSAYGIPEKDKLVLSLFFVGAVFCLGFSFVFHTLCCHSHGVCRAFSKLDYFGISLLTTCSSVSWLYYVFYCHYYLKWFYIMGVVVGGLVTALVSLMDKFSEPEWRAFRAGVFLTFGLFTFLPAIHYPILDGWLHYVQTSLGWLFLMGLLYVIGAALYAMRIPERFFPGKFDIWLHSHQIFHVFVVCAALVHYHGVTELALHRINDSQCEIESYLM